MGKKSMQCIEECALANDDLIPKRKPCRRQEFNVQQVKLDFLTIEIWRFTLKTRPGKGITAYAKTVLSRLILKFYVDLNNESRSQISSPEQ
jgi:hypothetical protein